MHSFTQFDNLQYHGEGGDEDEEEDETEWSSSSEWPSSDEQVGEGGGEVEMLR